MEFNGEWKIDPNRLKSPDKLDIAKKEIAIQLAKNIFEYLGVSQRTEVIDNEEIEIFETGFHVIKKDEMLSIKRTLYMLHSQRDISEITYQRLIKLLTD